MRFKMLTLATASLLAVSVPFAANAAKPEYGTWGYEPSAMDSSVKPGDDFWAYVNGSWDKRTQIAADRASAGPFVTLSDQSEKDVRQIVVHHSDRAGHLGGHFAILGRRLGVGEYLQQQLAGFLRPFPRWKLLQVLDLHD